MTDSNLRSLRSDKLTVTLVWIFRILVGCTFIMSGLTKMIDLYGVVYKIEQYRAVWGMMQPRTLVLGVAICLSGVEFILGFLLLLGCYKRSAVYLLTMIMAGMLALSAFVSEKLARVRAFYRLLSVVGCVFCDSVYVCHRIFWLQCPAID